MVGVLGLDFLYQVQACHSTKSVIFREMEYGRFSQASQIPFSSMLPRQASKRNSWNLGYRHAMSDAARCRIARGARDFVPPSPCYAGCQLSDKQSTCRARRSMRDSSISSARTSKFTLFTQTHTHTHTHTHAPTHPPTHTDVRGAHRGTHSQGA